MIYLIIIITSVLTLLSCRLWDPKSVRSGNGLPLLALRHLVSLPVSMPLRIVNRCWSCSCKWPYINVETFNLYDNPKINLVYLILSST